MKASRIATSHSGFTLVEVMIATSLSGIIVMAALMSLIVCKRMWFATNRELERAADGAAALQKMVSGVYASPGLRMAEWSPHNSTAIISMVNGEPSRIDYTFEGTNCFIKHDGSGSIVNQEGREICGNVARLLFTFVPEKPGTLRIDLTFNYGDSSPTEGITRLVTWVAMRNRS